MGDVLDYILDGLEQALELERELGVRSVEIDRCLLREQTAATPPMAPVAAAPVARPPAPVVRPPAPIRRPSDSAPAKSSPPRLPLVFLHHRPLSEKGVEMMAKIITAMGRTVENTPIVVVPPVPRARVVVVLGGRAMKLYYPDMNGEPGEWKKQPDGTDVLITNSPEYILRFDAVSPAVQKIKKEMWRSLKAVVQRLG